MNHDIREALHNLLSVMEMQEKRQSGEFHISGETFMGMWSDAKHNAREALAALDREGAGVVLPEYAEPTKCPEHYNADGVLGWVGGWDACRAEVRRLNATPSAAEHKPVQLYPGAPTHYDDGEPVECASDCPACATPPAAEPHDESQCWEPCGDLGKSEEHARPAPEHPELEPTNLLKWKVGGSLAGTIQPPVVERDVSGWAPELREIAAAIPQSVHDEVAREAAAEREGAVNPDCVICPACAHQFQAIPVNVQKRLNADAQDAALLDWLQKNEMRLHTYREFWDADDSEYAIWWQVVKGKKSISGHPLGSPRDAISAAIAAERKEDK